MIYSKADADKNKLSTDTLTYSDIKNEAEWLKDISKKERVYLVGEDDKELAIGLMSLRMMGYDAVMAVWE